jgi:hypothetical protein
MFCIYIAVFSHEFIVALSKYNGTGMAVLEKKLITSIAKGISGKNGHLKYHFNYLLLDPRVTNNLHSRMNSLG